MTVNKQIEKPTITAAADETRVGHVRQRLLQSCLIITLISQMIILILAIVLYSLLNWLNNYYAFTIAMAVVIIVEVITIYCIVELLVYPLDMIARATANATDEKPAINPPNPNMISGLVGKETAKIVKYIYEQYSPNQTKLEGEVSSELMALSLLHSLPIGIVALDSNLNILAFNDQAPIYQVGHEQIIQLDFRSSGQPVEEWLDQVRHTSVSATKTWTRIQDIPMGGVQPRHVYDVVANYRQQPNNGVNVIIITIDKTTDYTESEDNIDFVALAAHELRGPITVIRGYLDMLSEQIYSTSPKEQQDLLDRLNVSARRLASYVNNVLNANRYDRRHLKLKLAKIKLADIVSDIKNDLNLRASTVNRHIVWAIPGNLPAVAADRSSISEVITNLVDNAIKYSYDGGQIEITARKSGDFVDVMVADHGIGIAQSATEHLFTKFYRSHRSSASIGGTGIGLYISRAIVESHGGTIGVDSAEGRGSVFTFTLPVYSAVKDNLDRVNSSNEQMITKESGLIRNHGAIRE